MRRYCEENLAEYIAQGCTVTFWMCPLCGWYRWLSATEKGGGFKIVVDNLFEEGQCPKCQEVAQRSPEIFQWVLSVIGHQTSQALRVPT